MPCALSFSTSASVCLASGKNQLMKLQLSTPAAGTLLKLTCGIASRWALRAAWFLF